MSAESGYVAAYIRQITTQKVVDPPDPNPSENCYELLETLYVEHQQGGPETALAAWKIMVSIEPSLTTLILNGRFIHALDLKYLPTIEWLIPGMIPKRALIEVHGLPGSGKTFLMLDFAMQIAQQQVVIYVAPEGVYGYQPRVEAWQKANDKEPGQLFFDKQALNLLDPIEVQAFIDACKSKKPVLIIFDTLARCMVGGDENSAKDMGLLIQHCSQIIKALDTSVVLVHHTGKNGEAERGSSALRGACDSMIEISKTDEIIVVKSSKLKDGKPFETFSMKLKPFGHSVAPVPVEIEPEEEEEIPSKHRGVLDYLRDHPEGAPAGEIANEVAPDDTHFDRIISKLKSEALIEQHKNRGPYFLTEQGRALLGD